MMERTTFEPFTKQKNDVNEYSSPAFEQLRNMMLPDTDVYKPKKKNPNKKGLEEFMNDDE